MPAGSVLSLPDLFSSMTGIGLETTGAPSANEIARIGREFKQSGMIWSLGGAKALLPLRALHKSNRLEEFFQHLVKDLRQVDCAA